MKWFRRGRHRANKFSIRVADIQAQIIGERLVPALIAAEKADIARAQRAQLHAIFGTPL